MIHSFMRSLNVRIISSEISSIIHALERLFQQLSGSCARIQGPCIALDAQGALHIIPPLHWSIGQRRREIWDHELPLSPLSDCMMNTNKSRDGSTMKVQGAENSSQPPDSSLKHPWQKFWKGLHGMSPWTRASLLVLLFVSLLLSNQTIGNLHLMSWLMMYAWKCQGL
jgi:hypothetical protein